MEKDDLGQVWRWTAADATRSACDGSQDRFVPLDPQVQAKALFASLGGQKYLQKQPHACRSRRVDHGATASLDAHFRLRALNTRASPHGVSGSKSRETKDEESHNAMRCYRCSVRQACRNIRDIDSAGAAKHQAVSRVLRWLKAELYMHLPARYCNFPRWAGEWTTA